IDYQKFNKLGELIIFYKWASICCRPENRSFPVFLLISSEPNSPIAEILFAGRNAMLVILPVFFQQGGNRKRWAAAVIGR
ncbi:MAG TPA: hypothetical protein VNE41_10615, partial [Chitinophagaceae bacterium]|nr:hypothetical protein [Chitinophagaceae bacterium]